jgi:hypothetical protein
MANVVSKSGTQHRFMIHGVYVTGKVPDDVWCKMLTNCIKYQKTVRKSMDSFVQTFSSAFLAEPGLMRQRAKRGFNKLKRVSVYSYSHYLLVEVRFDCLTSR